MEKIVSPYKIFKYPISKRPGKEIAKETYPVFVIPGDFGIPTDGVFVTNAAQSYCLFKNKSIDIVGYSFFFGYEPTSYSDELS
jgi:hypothetical protein